MHITFGVSSPGPSQDSCRQFCRITVKLWPLGFSWKDCVEGSIKGSCMQTSYCIWGLKRNAARVVPGPAETLLPCGFQAPQPAPGRAWDGGEAQVGFGIGQSWVGALILLPMGPGGKILISLRPSILIYKVEIIYRIYINQIIREIK